MKLREVFRFELAYQVRRPWPWLIFAVVGVLTFLMARDLSLNEALYDDFFANSPFAIAKTSVFGTLIWLLGGAIVAGEAAARDVATGMHPLTYTAPVAKRDYLGGRFLAALVLNATILLAVPAGVLAGVHSPGMEAASMGPFRPAAFLTAYGFLTLPNAFFATAVQFWLATRSGRPMAGYAGSLLLVFMGFFVASLLLFHRGLGTLLDPIGIRFIVEDIAHLWTTAEKSTRLLALEGIVLRNRLLWLGVGAGALAATYAGFRFSHRTGSAWWERIARPFGGPEARGREARAPTPAGLRVAVSASIHVPRVARSFGLAIHARRTVAIAWASFRAIATSWAGLALLAGIPLLAVVVLLDQMSFVGVPLIPTTPMVLEELTAPLSAELSRWVIVPLLLVYFAGELVWRERDAGLGEITDAMPGSDWAPFLGKLLGLGLVLVAFMAALTAAGVLAQAILDHQDFRVGLYLRVLLGLQLPEYLLFATLALVVHVVVDQRYIGHLVATVAYVFLLLPGLFGVEHDLLVYGAGPGWSYTEMRGFGPSLEPWAWFRLYWAAWALLLAVVARLLWVRGREGGLGVRLRLARGRLTRATVRTAAAAVALILGLGGFIFYNTNVLNAYVPESEVKELQAEYERRYGRYADVPQPRLEGARLRVEIYPERRALEIRGAYHLVNGSAVAIDSVHLAIVPAAEIGAVAFDRAAAPVLVDEDRGHRIYALERPLQPGDSLRLDFEVRVEPHGFRESGVDPAVVANGTFFTNDWLPAIGYQRRRELTSPTDRREHGLAQRRPIPSLQDAEAREERGEGIDFQAVVGTDDDQVAVAPGALRGTWTEGGRRYFHYAAGAPIGGEWAFFSADYEVHEARWEDSDGSGGDVGIRIFHHPGHTANLDRLVRAVRASLDYYTRRFGPYPFDHLSVVENPGNEIGMHADASLIRFAEGTAVLDPEGRPRGLDLPFAVMAHEVAHQWWGHQLAAAYVEGAPVLSESLAGYSAMRVVEETLGREHLQRLLRFMRSPFPYPTIRRGEPLLRAIDPYLAYRKGPFALHALSEYMGAERVNTALRRLLEKHRAADAPLATTLDLYRELRAVTPDSLQDLLHDLFEVNALWELRAERASAERTAEGAWQVTLEVRARKVVIDSAGVETEVPMDEWVEVGVFGAPEEGAGRLSEPIYLEWHRIRSGQQTITATVPCEPLLAGIDPYHVLDFEEREDDDNIEAVGRP